MSTSSDVPAALRPRIICHMMMSIDGRIMTDEVSVLVTPVVDGRVGTPALFDVEGAALPPQRLALEAVERRADDVLWLRYRVVSR
jgi:riboflavin biosynthesis pyrimidine reductase